MNPAYFGPGFAAVPNVCFWQILLRKSAMTGAWRLRDLLELAACHPLPDKGMV
jgi:hypothetical protein